MKAMKVIIFFLIILNSTSQAFAEKKIQLQAKKKE